MTMPQDTATSRRALLKTGGLFAGALMIPGAVSAGMRDASRRGAPESLLPDDFFNPSRTPAAQPAIASATVQPTLDAPGVNPQLLQRALAALERHGSRIAKRDRMAVADFSAGSNTPRFHLINLESGRTVSKLVAHGSGSDPAHTGYLQRFSNQNGSNASCEGAFATADYYVGKHGRSQRLLGLDPTNDNALDRAIVVHAAWYANPDMIRERGMLGRSQGCFAVGESELTEVFERLGPGRMIYAAKV
ncbi:transcriptional initiation protein Tat [Sphingomonas endophytica]|uniref:Transcriptional initiation protein Tat n=2 Tax=Sphingomonas endophytica TaxID=869719 RepID=A0A147HZU4_9SPHN|nr:transcriptional initiation protein Tat [Sphingomonas endophytica]